MTSTVRWGSRWALGVVMLSTVVATTGGVAALAATPRTTPNFNDPAAIVTTGTHVWVANFGSSSLTQLSTAGTVTLHVSDHHGDLVGPQALAGTATDLFVANRNSTISEFNSSTGVFERTISAHTFHFGDPVAMTVDGANLWVLNQATNSLTEIAVATGHLVRTVANTPFGAVAFATPSAITTAGADLWVTNEGTNSVTEVLARTGAIVRVISASADSFATPAGIAYEATHIWVTDSATASLTELSASTGALVQVITNSSLDGGYGFQSPSVILAGAGVVYVASPPGGSPMITQIETTSGIANWMMCNTNYPFNFLNPDGLTIAAGNLFVANGANNTLSEMNASTGVWVQDVS
jgi:hypothetical protein